MNVSRQEDPRANQKERTRTAIVEAAMEIVRSGITPTVQAAAEAAKVSRATAYRYFPTQDSLLHEVMYVTPSLEFVEDVVHEMEGDDARARLRRLLDVFNSTVLREEAPYRAAIRMSLETWFAGNNRDAAPRVRAGRRMRWLPAALAPLKNRLSEATWRRLNYSLALTLGIDSVIIMRDVCGIEDDEELLDVLRWTAEAVVSAAEAEGVRSPAYQ